MQDKLEKELKKKALGYTVTESSEEYANIEGKMQLTKQKITKKHIPPDIGAYKLLLELKGGGEAEEMTEEELTREKARLLALLSRQEKEEKEIAKQIKPKKEEEKAASTAKSKKDKTAKLKK